MGVTIHSANSGELLSNIARQYFGSPSAASDIIVTNQFLDGRKTTGIIGSDGLPQVIGGDAILIITPDDQVIQSSVSGVSDQNLTMYMNGKEHVIPRNGTEVDIGFDSCTNSFDSIFPWDPSDFDERRLWNPDDYPEIEIYQGETKIFGGKVEIGQPETSATRSSIVCSARTFTYLLEKSVFPKSAYPTEREKENLLQTVTWAAGVFDLQVDNLAEATKQHKKTSFENSSTPWSYLSRIATNDKRVLRCSLDGRKIEIVNSEATTPVAKFTEGVDGFAAPKFNFNTENIKGNHIGQRKSAKSVGSLVTEKNPYFNENSYTFHKMDDIDRDEISDSLKYQILKSYRDFFTTSFIVPGIVNPQTNKRWQRGECITVNAPSSMVYTDYLFMLQNIKLRIEAEKVYTELTIIPPNVYNGEPLESKPWDF